MRALSDRELLERRIIDPRRARKREMRFARIETEQQRAARARFRQRIRQQKCRGCSKVRRFGESRQQRQTSSFGRRRQSAFSSFSLMLTKLYGGHGPEYLNE